MHFSLEESAFLLWIAMNLPQLRHLVALAELGSFTQAAKHVHVTQPALSRSITQLEAEFGGTLFDRIGHRNEITALGRAVLEHARHVLLEADALWSSVKSQTSGDGGQLVLGLGSTPSELLIEPLMSHMARNLPAPRLTFMRGAQEQQIEELRARTLDASVLHLGGFSNVPDDLHIDPLPKLRLGFLCRRDHPMASRTQLGFDALLDWPLVTTLPNQGLIRQMIDCYGPHAHPSKCVSLSCEAIDPMMRTVLASDAIYLGTLAPALRLIGEGAVVELPVRPRLGHSTFGIVRLAARSVPPPLELVRSLVFDLMREAATDSEKDFDTAGSPG